MSPMAIMEVEFFSHCLQRYVTFNAIVPVGDKAFGNVKDNFASLYLLHGLGGNYRDWLNYSKLAYHARGRNLAIFMPSAENKSYIDNPHTKEKFGEFIGTELVEFTRRLLPLSHKREDTAIGGLSMGGYGAMRNGLKYHDTFGSIISLSGALAAEILHKIATEDEPRPNRRKSSFEGVFGDLAAIPGSDMDCSALLKKLIVSDKQLPKIYMTCGTEDELLAGNRMYHKIFKDNDIAHIYNETPGGHDWLYWDEQIPAMLDWLDGR